MTKVNYNANHITVAKALGIILMVIGHARINRYLNSAALFLVRYFYILKWHFWDLSIDMGIFWGSWFLHNHEIPHPNQWGSMITTKKYCLFNEDFSVVGFICI